ncbi:hypothetical protein GN244_ATG19067 [Phytophthora infestans]|uniref:Uncharacterized protein n=1 Tax=Phytophthora infestans TaxID=4787 RepID=A0A833SK43_PHYIN|nr:hypothetical protein GN244_ATG19067 [Phytophthora infestans]
MLLLPTKPRRSGASLAAEAGARLRVSCCSQPRGGARHTRNPPRIGRGMRCGGAESSCASSVFAKRHPRRVRAQRAVEPRRVVRVHGKDGGRLSAGRG